jgi:hypothetical protein
LGFRSAASNVSAEMNTAVRINTDLEIARMANRSRLNSNGFMTTPHRPMIFTDRRASTGKFSAAFDVELNSA